MARYRLSSRKPKAPAWLCYATAGLYVAVLVLVVVWLVGGLLWGCLMGAAGVVVLLAVMNCCLSWYAYAELEEGKNGLEYRYYSAADMGGLGKSVYTIRSVSGYAVKGKNLKVFGDITLKEPMRKVKHLDKMVIYDYTRDCEVLLSKLRAGE